MPSRSNAQKKPKPAGSNGSSLFTRFSKWTAQTMGRPTAFIVAAIVIVVWGVTGPIFHYSDTWQLIINTSTTIVTFLMVFLIQATQNRDSAAIHVKLDELIRAIGPAKNSMIDLDDLSEEELSRIQKHYRSLAKKSKEELREMHEDSITVEEATKKT